MILMRCVGLARGSTHEVGSGMSVVMLSTTREVIDLVVAALTCRPAQPTRRGATIRYDTMLQRMKVVKFG